MESCHVCGKTGPSKKSFPAIEMASSQNFQPEETDSLEAGQDTGVQSRRVETGRKWDERNSGLGSFLFAV